MKLIIEGTKEEIASVLAGIKKEESSMRKHVTTTEYGYRPEESGLCKKSEIKTVIGSDSQSAVIQQ